MEPIGRSFVAELNTSKEQEKDQIIFARLTRKKKFSVFNHILFSFINFARIIFMKKI